ncbi:polysaccharide deacetylase family protein [Robertkochia flava]|uniref:polysaccharide deacetylase family protein n=1 Tax=Robertkochia flava TaxID=3447986 RepID=UPI001CCEF77A|nr:polysaccharide deacetylase family protein [Robertkochia marina]
MAGLKHPAFFYMKPYLFKTPALVERLYPDLEWKAEKTRKTVYLTFDDGPTPVVTPYVLEQLETYHARATFFCIGKNIDHHPELFRTLLSKGHRIGNHTFNHLNASKSTPDIYMKEVEKTEERIALETGSPGKKETPLFRPPYGKINKKITGLLHAQGYRVIMWSLLSADFDPALNTAKSLSSLKKHTRPGSIIVFHDSLKAFENLKVILPEYLKFLNENGFEMESL